MAGKNAFPAAVYIQFVSLPAGALGRSRCLPSHRPSEGNVTSEGVAVYGRAGYWPLPEIVKDTLLPGRQLDDERPILTKVDIAHGIDHVRVGRGDQRLCIQALLPHWQDVVASTKARL